MVSVDPIEVTREMAVRGAEFGPGPYGIFMRRFGLEAEDIVMAVRIRGAGLARAVDELQHPEAIFG